MSFRHFWPHYLRAHRRKQTRVAHYVATILAFAAIAVALYYRMPVIALVAIALSYAIALTSHHVFERNKSLVFVNPAWGAMADLKMCWLALTGGLTAELAMHVPQHAPETPQRPGADGYLSADGDSLRRVMATRQQP